MGRLFNLLRKDIILGIKDVFVILEIGFAVFMMLLLLFVIPEHIEIKGIAYIYDPTGIVEDFVVESYKELAKEREEDVDGREEVAKRSKEFYVDSREEVIEGMVKDTMAIGLIITETKDDKYNVELLTQPYTSEAFVKYIDIDMDDVLSLLKPPRWTFYPPDVFRSVEVRALQFGLKDDIPFNQRLLPPVILMMVGIMGLFVMVSLLGQERSEATIKAFQVSPASMWEFVISKHLMLLLLSFITFSTLYIPMMGFSGYPEALLITMLSVLIGSSIGVILGGIFDNPMASILWVLLLMIIFALPAISFFSPSFSPEWLKFIPSYHTLFGLDAAMFPDNNSHIIWQSAIVLVVIDVVLFTLSGLIFNKLVRKEA